MKVQSIGLPLLSPSDIKLYLDGFLEAYKDRPLRNNHGGMRSPHCFATWCMLKKLAPNFIVESGVHRGQGTWLMEKALPGVKIFSIDPSLSKIKYRSRQAKYFTSDFSNINWIEEAVIPHQTVCFFDDHQNAPPRLSIAAKFGFKQLIFEDNYPRGQGDCLSLKQSLETTPSGFPRDQIKTYWEFPPIAKSEYVRWNHDRWEDNLYPTAQPILSTIQSQYKVFFDESQSYTWMCYVELP